MSLQQRQVLDYHAALSRFDAAVAESLISYSPTEPIRLTDNGFEFQFRVCPQFLRKPGLPPVHSSPVPAESDIRQIPALHIAAIPPSHTLIFNAFPILRPSYLLLTASPTHHQSSPLSLADITAARSILASLSHEDIPKNDGEAGDYMVIYNSGRAAGCSRFHKHMQLLPRPPHSSFRLFPDRPPEEPANVPYIYHLIRHAPSPSTPSSDDHELPARILGFYTASLNRFRGLLGIQGDNEPVPHNVVMTREWTVVIPRRRADVGGIGTNAVGMMGMVWVGIDEALEEWKRRGPWEVLGQLGLSAEREGPGEVMDASGRVVITEDNGQ